MHPAIFITASVILGILFALQEWSSMRQLGYHPDVAIYMEEWGAHFFFWGILCWLLWRLLNPQVQSASIRTILFYFLPLSIIVSAIEEMVVVFIFPQMLSSHKELTYWRKVTVELYADLVDDLVMFWCAFFLFRGIGYYQRYRENERTAAQLEIRLANAQIAALRMQLNPHFLFNTMNGISSLMRTDVDAADTMLEQLSSLLRITLERGNVQLITLHEEMEFIEMYLAMQDQRYAGRVEQTLLIEPELHDALVPAMILQPIVENAFVHGLSKLVSNGELLIESHKDDGRIILRVTNTGVGLGCSGKPSSSTSGIGLVNVKSRLELHYGRDATLSMIELAEKRVEVTLKLPLQYSQTQPEELARFGA